MERNSRNLSNSSNTRSGDDLSYQSYIDQQLKKIRAETNSENWKERDEALNLSVEMQVSKGLSSEEAEEYHYWDDEHFLTANLFCNEVRYIASPLLSLTPLS